MGVVTENIRNGGALGRRLTSMEREHLSMELKEKVRELLDGEPHPAEDMLPDYVLTMVENQRTRTFVSGELAPLLPEQGVQLGRILSEWLWVQLAALGKDAVHCGNDGAKSVPKAPHGVGDTEEVSRPILSVNQNDDSMASSTADGGSMSLNDARHVIEEARRQNGGRLQSRPADATAPLIDAKPAKRQKHNSGNHAEVSKTAHMDVNVLQGSAENDRHRDEPPLGRESQNDATLTKPPTADDVPKCQFWPHCKKGDECKFYHPTEPCKFYPNCRSGERCRFIHPTSGRFPASAGLVMMQKMMQMNPQAMMAPPCKFGFACERRRTNHCSFAHPLIACRFGKNCKRQHVNGASSYRGICAYSHAPICRNGWDCHRVGCTFAHPAKPSGDTEHTEVHQQQAENTTPDAASSETALQQPSSPQDAHPMIDQELGSESHASIQRS